MIPAPAIVAAATVATVSAVGAAVWAATSHPTLFDNSRDIPRTLAGRPLATRELLTTFADTRGKWQTGTPPASAHEVDILAPYWTGFVPEHGTQYPRTLKWSQSAALFRLVVRRTREALQACGREDEDVRAVLWLHCLETGWGKACWCFNSGNRKSRPWGTRAGILSGRCLTANPNASAVYLLRDAGRSEGAVFTRSFDAYGAFASLEITMAEEKRFFEQTSNSAGTGPRYGDVLPGYRQGGLDGLLRARTAQHRGGYSPGVLENKLAGCRSYWNLASRLAGDEWRR